MARLRWTLNQRWTDHQRGIDISGPGVYDVPDEAVDHYLEHQSDGWEQPWDDEEEESEAEGESDESDTYSRDELEEMEYSELQDLAQERDIKATQTTEELVDALAED